MRGSRGDKDERFRAAKRCRGDLGGLDFRPMEVWSKGSYAGWVVSSIPLIGSEYFIRMEEVTV